MNERPRRPWINCVLGLLCAGAIVLAILVVGPASGSQTAARRTARAVRGVVQSTVSGSGNLQAASQLDLGFKTSGTVTHIYVTQGEHVTEGRLLAELDPSSAEVTLEQARASLRAAEAKLAKEEETGGESSASQGSTASAPANAASGTASAVPRGSAKAGREKVSEGEGTETKSSPPSSGATLSVATREANLASAEADAKSDKLTVRSDEEALASTKLYAPETGTIVSLTGQVGEVVSANGTTRAASASGSSGSTGGSGSAASGAASSGRSSGSSGSSVSGSSSTPFAVLSDLSSMLLVAPVSESEIGNVRVGQIATVTVEALEGRELAAHVSAVSILSTSSSGVVSYDVTFQLDQMDPGLRPGMSASAEVVVKQAEGVSVPTSAISAGSVTVVRDGKDVPQRVTTGLAGNSSTIVLSGVEAGDTVVLPTATSTRASTSLTSRLGNRLGGALGGGGGAVFFRGGG
jgi:multidrug efflux pump subunit AcrA (membrane-fusion protein)